MTKMAAMIIYGKKPTKIFSYRTNSPMIMKLGMEQYVIKLNKDYINDDPELNMTQLLRQCQILRNLFLYLQ